MWRTASEWADSEFRGVDWAVADQLGPLGDGADAARGFLQHNSLAVGYALQLSAVPLTPGSR